MTTTSGLTITRRDLASYADACAALQDLRIMMTALGHDLVQAGGDVVT